MNKARLRHEIQVLTDRIAPATSHDLEDGVVQVEDFPLPANCQPETTTVKINIPDAYPYRMPTLYVSDQIQVDGETPPALWEEEVNDWFLYDLHWLRGMWVPERSTIFTALNFLRTTLKYPQTNRL